MPSTGISSRGKHWTGSLEPEWASPGRNVRAPARRLAPWLGRVLLWVYRWHDGRHGPGGGIATLQTGNVIAHHKSMPSASRPDLFVRESGDKCHPLGVTPPDRAHWSHQGDRAGRGGWRSATRGQGCPTTMTGDVCLRKRETMCRSIWRWQRPETRRAARSAGLLISENRAIERLFSLSAGR